MNLKVVDILVEEGMSPEDARKVIDCFETADAYGVSSHGMAIFDSHLARIKRGGYNLTPDFRVIRETASFAVIDGDNAIDRLQQAIVWNMLLDIQNKSGYLLFLLRITIHLVLLSIIHLKRQNRE